ncbi:MAG: hypothetical protein LBL49_00380 [Clostridiales Family XIII bacterium]|jgi:hypothetical protein|nr:hypothetical protein [Clostridiales Family XIII bacterium]
MGKGERLLVQKALTAILAVALCFNVYGAEYVSGAERDVVIRQAENVFNVMQGDVEYTFSMNLVNEGNNSFSNITAEIGNAKGFTDGRLVSGATTLGAKETATYFFKVDIESAASPGNVSLPITFYHGGTKLELASVNARFSVGRKVSSVSGYDLPVIDVAYKLPDEKLTAGKSTDLTLTLANRGNIMLQDVQVTLELPEKMRIDSGFTTQYVGYMAIAEEKTVRLPIFVEENAENKNYQIKVKMSALGKGATASFDRTINISVVGGIEKTTSQAIEISGVNLPQEAAAGKDFTLSFNVKNTGKDDLKNVKVDAVGDEGIVNRTKNIFIEPILKPGETKTYSVTFFSAQNAAGQKSYTVKMTAAGAANTGNVSQYGSIFITKDTTTQGAVKTPQLIIDNYNYGGAPVLAGTNFGLQMGFLNTSAVKLINIKVSLKSDTGAFIPFGSSGSFYIDSVEAKGSISKQMTMSVSPTAEFKTTALNVEMKYENESGQEFTATELISIPVIQTTSLTVDDIIGPPELYPYSMAGVDVRFYNTGKTVLSNLRVTAEGNFDIAGDAASYYSGNMQSGANDSYGLSFTTREAGPLNGKVIFTYDDPSGNQKRFEKEFSFQVVDMGGAGGGMGDLMPDDDASQTSNIKYIIAGAAVILVIILIAVIRILKRRKMHKELELDE